ncbi:hypothetical protein, partial [Aliidiomarina sp.]|uniref:hypothetical protein n=1 Tax=Aliidiomarina sp. TaxID=1872439 RepID=UPI003A4D880F
MKPQLFNPLQKNVQKPNAASETVASTASASANADAKPSETHIKVSANAADINRLRGHVNDLSIPYVEVRFNTRLREVEKLWPLYTLNLSSICQEAEGSCSQAEGSCSEAEGSCHQAAGSSKQGNT